MEDRYHVGILDHYYSIWNQTGREASTLTKRTRAELTMQIVSHAYLLLQRRIIKGWTLENRVAYLRLTRDCALYSSQKIIFSGTYLLISQLGEEAVIPVLHCKYQLDLARCWCLRGRDAVKHHTSSMSCRTTPQTIERQLTCCMRPHQRRMDVTIRAGCYQQNDDRTMKREEGNEILSK